MTDYSKTIIYVIKCLDDNITEEYVGSTTDFINRKNQHKFSCNNENNKDYNLKIYKFIRENGGWDNWILIELEKYPCDNGNDARKREEEVRVERKASLNSIKAFITETKQEYNKEYNKEYYEANKEKRKEQMKKWEEENKEKIKERQKKWEEENKEKIKERQKKWEEENKEKIKERKKKYFEENKDKIKEQQKKWREQNKDKIKEQQKKWRENREQITADL
jgi:hypothetical protein